MNIYILIICILSILLIWLVLHIIRIRYSLKNMAEELEKTRKEGYNRQLKLDLADSKLNMLAKEINKNLDYQKNLKLEDQSSRRQLQQSISDIAHDLRTPLTVIRGNLQLLEKEEISEKGRQYLEISEKKAVSLKEMVDEFFELSILESDGEAALLEKLDMTLFMTEFLLEHEAIIREKNLEPLIHFPDKAIYANVNRDMLSRVLSNLISNIFKYAEEDFEVSLKEAEGAALIRIGNYIKDSDKASLDLEHIFDRTYRADKARTQGGAGLGLYIAKMLVEKQKGSIRAFIEEDINNDKTNNKIKEKLFFEIVFYD
ncbi:MAG: HAMP domain-containing histidine kinase [Eubacterium sp.]|nr:HAMP domain-containing histidine kinase [Eubacterium sp.]